MSRSGFPQITKFETFDMKLEEIENKVTIQGKPQKVLNPDMMSYAPNQETESGKTAQRLLSHKQNIWS